MEWEVVLYSREEPRHHSQSGVLCRAYNSASHITTNNACVCQIDVQMDSNFAVICKAKLLKDRQVHAYQSVWNIYFGIFCFNIYSQKYSKQHNRHKYAMWMQCHVITLVVTAGIVCNTLTLPDNDWLLHKEEVFMFLFHYFILPRKKF